LDFTLSKYRELCRTIFDSGYSVLTVARCLSEQENRSGIVVLRHDVDRLPGRALRMARLEHEIGLQATYYFRMTPAVFKPQIINDIVSLGHEIGYHYETLSKARGDLQFALLLFSKELKIMREICEIRTISMHGSPLSPYDNRVLWKHFDFHDFGLLGEVYLSIDYEKTAYFTDTGRSWGSKFNIRDRVPEFIGDSIEIESTDDLVSIIRSQRISRLCIQTHPERWTSDLGEWISSWGMDLGANQLKTIIRLVYRQC
jgi:hypothetical protein